MSYIVRHEILQAYIVQARDLTRADGNLVVGEKKKAKRFRTREQAEAVVRDAEAGEGVLEIQKVRARK